MSEEKNYRDMFESLQRLHNSTNEAVIVLQKENGNLKSEVILLNAKLVNCQSALDINKEIMRNALTRQNELTVSHNEEIQVLKDKIKAFESKKV